MHENTHFHPQIARRSTKLTDPKKLATSYRHLTADRGWAPKSPGLFSFQLLNYGCTLPFNEAGLLFLFYRLARCKQSCEYPQARPPAMSTDSPSSPTVSSQGTTTRPQADPLPTKRGEIGYRESLNPPAPSNAETGSEVTAQQNVVPARHPADRELPPAPSGLGPSPITNASNNQSSARSRPSTSPPLTFRQRSTKRGVRSSTIFLLVTQGSLLLLTIALWIILARLVLPSSVAGRQIGLNVCIHMTFVTCTVVQVVLLERVIFRYRAERYAMLHPGEIVPDLFNRGEQVSVRLALAPWNRPSLPTVSDKCCSVACYLDILKC